MSIVVGQSTWQLRPGRIIDGGTLICKSGGNLWIVAPSSSEVTRVGLVAGDAVTQATNVTGKTGWFLPSLAQLQNPGYVCRDNWDSYNANYYWSSTGGFADSRCALNFANGVGCAFNQCRADFNFFGRAFKLLTY